MSLGRRSSLRFGSLPQSGAILRGSFYDSVEAALQVDEVDHAIEEVVRPYYAERRGRPSIPPGIYFRIVFVGAVEGIASQRELAWRCDDSISLRRFLGFPITRPTPDHSTLSLMRKRLPLTLHAQILRMMMASAQGHGALRGRQIALTVPWLNAGLTE